MAWRVKAALERPYWRGVALKPFPQRSLLRFARNLKRLRLEAEFSQERLAAKLDLDPRHYQKLEAAQVTPSFGLLIRVSRVFRCAWDVLLEGV